MPKRKPKKLSWFTARCHFKSEVTGKPKSATQLWEETFFLMHALSHKHAESKAKQMARREQTKYKNSAGQTVSWKFAALLEVHELISTRIEDGTEVYSRFFGRRPTPNISARKK